jgi:hypothetical protein
MSSAHTAHIRSTAAASAGKTEIRVRGKAISVQSAQIDGRTVIATGKWLKVAAIKDEEFVEGEPVADPKRFVAALQETGLKADLFTFTQKLPDVVPRHAYHLEWDNPAVIPISTFSEWWDRRVEPSVRRAVRKAAKSGVVVRQVDFDDDFVRGIAAIFDETPIRQGRVFWHYHKDLETVRRENSTFPDRSVYIGAYHNDELIGFMWMVFADKAANVVQLLSRVKDYDKRPSNALIAKAVEICEQQGISQLVYCSYIYNDPNSSLTEFKRRNGFQQVFLPRYYVPLTLKGRLALTLKLHHRLVDRIPKPLIGRLLKIRTRWYHRRFELAKDSL